MTGRDSVRLTAADAVEEINGLRTYINELYMKISKAWSLQVPMLTDSNRLDRQKYRAPARAKKNAGAGSVAAEDDASVVSETEA